jgi:hypothetical protein
VALDQELSSRYVDCVRESAEIINLGCLTPVFEAPDACPAGNEFPYYFAAILHQGGGLLQLGFLALCLYGLK